MSKWTINQEKAINESGKNIIVSAGAGSGKTSVLTQRVIEKINNGIHINELLILTFTTKAAMEMKTRIRHNLKDMPNELNLLSSSYITTFDSYALSVVRKYHYLLNIPKNISITDEPILDIKCKKIMDDTFEYFYNSNNENFNNLITNNSLKNDKYLKKVLLGLSKKAYEYNFENYYNYIKNIFFNDSTINIFYNEYINLINEKRNDIKENFSNLSNYFEPEYIEKIKIILNDILNSDIKELFLIHNIEKIPTIRNIDDSAKEAKNKLTSSINDLFELTKYGDYDSIKETIISEKENVLTILEIIKKYLSELKKYKSENNIYTFYDISYLAIKIFKENEFVRKEVSSSFKEIMIDEYQDTNDIEDEFISLISNNNVYVVGDIKQSIYKFRGSNPNIFKDKYELLKNSNEGLTIDLLENFRSRKNVVDNINSIFSIIMDKKLGECDYSNEHLMIYGNKSYDTKEDFNYDIDIFEYEENENFTNEEIEIFKIGNDIKEKVNKVKVFDKNIGDLRYARYNDFAIILDESKYFNDFKKIFEYLSIPLNIIKDEFLNVNIEIFLIKNMIDFIIKINEKKYDNDFLHDFMSICRSFLYEIDDNEIFDIVTNKKYEESFVYNEFKKISNINSKTPCEIINDIIKITDFYNKIYKIGNYEEVSSRIKEIYNIAEYLNKNGNDIYDFNDFLKDVIENNINIKASKDATDVNAVNIMTIHASKGLEFPICYFADLDHKFNIRDINEKFIIDKKYGIITNKDSFLKTIYKISYLNEMLSEKLRLFYVALTRSKEKIILVIPKIKDNNIKPINEFDKTKWNKFTDFLKPIKFYYSDYFKEVNIDSLNLTKNYLYKKDINKIKENNHDIVVEEINIISNKLEEKHYSKDSLKLINKDERNIMDIGIKIHEILEYIDLKNPILKTEDNFIKEKIISFLKNDLLKNISNAKIYKEFEFIYKEKDLKHGIIDLMLEYDDHIDIIDYKLKNINDENYLKQLNGYKEYITKLSNKTVNIYLYSIIDEKVSKL